MTLRRICTHTAAIALTAVALAAPAASAKPIDPPLPPVATLSAQTNARTDRAERGMAWETIVIGVAGGVLVVGVIAGIGARTRRTARARISA